MFPTLPLTLSLTRYVAESLYFVWRPLYLLLLPLADSLGASVKLTPTLTLTSTPSLTQAPTLTLTNPN